MLSYNPITMSRKYICFARMSLMILYVLMICNNDRYNTSLVMIDITHAHTHTHTHSCLSLHPTLRQG